MSKPYIPQSGTIPHRVVEYLRRLAPGTWVASGPLADELDITQSSIIPCMVAAVHHGVVKRDRRDGIVHWSLGDGTAMPAPVEEEDDPEMKSKIVLTPAAVAQAAVSNDKLAKRLEKAIKRDPPDVAGPDTSQLGAQIQLDLPDQEPLFGAFSDGSLSIEQGGTFLRLGEKHAQALQAFMRKAWDRA